MSTFAADYIANVDPTATVEQIRSIKIVEYLRRTVMLDDVIAQLHPNGTLWKDNIEGNTLAYFDKVKKMSELADDPRVETICEIGFNSGYSMLNFLTANPTARAFSFDIISNTYVPAAVNALHEVFPYRNIAIIAGSSAHTVPKMTDTLVRSNTLCNLLFIDGGHTAQILRDDITNMAKLANTTYNRVVVDDIHIAHLKAVWDEMIAHPTMGFVPLKWVDSDSYGCLDWGLAADGWSYVFDFRVEECKKNYESRGLEYRFRPGSLGVATFQPAPAGASASAAASTTAAATATTATAGGN
jgi:hypothetical protein